MVNDDTSPRAWEMVLAHIESELSAGALRAGDRLPGERSLSTELGVGRSSVREALRVLEAMGLVRTAAGSGPGAGAVIVAAPAGGMRSLLRLQMAVDEFPAADVIRARVALEGEVAALLAENGGDLSEAREALSRMADPTLDLEAFVSVDAAFHDALARAAGNRVIMATMAAMRVAIDDYVRRSIGARVGEWPEIVPQLHAEHVEVLTAIEAGDPEVARSIVRAHITTVGHTEPDGVR